MEIVRDKVFENRRVPIDGIRFEGCTFANTKLIFSAADPVAFERCTFISCEWVFQDAALQTLQFLAALYDGLGTEGAHLVEAVFESVQQGSLGEKLFQPERASAA